MSLTQEQEKYYDTYLDLFNSTGWKQYIKDHVSAYEELKNKAFNGDQENFFFIKGQINMLGKTLGFENSIRTMYEDLIQQEQEHVDSLSI